jgi:hypothetical protein
MEDISEITSPEGKSAGEVLVAIQRAKKNLRMYPENNPIYMRTVEEAYKKTMSFFEHADTMDFNIQRNDIRMGEEVVYVGDDHEENLALFFFRDGLRSLEIDSGLTEVEFLEFLKVISVDFESERVEEDIITLLWERDFKHVRYKVDDSVLVEDDGFQEESVSKVTENATEEGVLQEAYEAPPMPEEIVQPLTPMPVTPEDMEELEKEIALNDEEKFENLTDVLFEMLYASSNLEEFKDVARIMNSAIDHAVRSGKLALALVMFKRIREIIKQTKSENVKKTLMDVLKYAGSEDVVKQIGELLDRKDGMDVNVFKEYVSVLSTDAIPKLVSLLGELQSIQGRKKAIMALTFIGRRDVPALAKFLDDERWYVVRNLILILRETKDKRALGYIANTLDHPEPRVRREAIKGIGDLGGLKYIDRIVLYLYDEDHKVSVAAAHALGRLRNRVGLDALTERLRDKKLLEAEPALVRKYFEALATFKYDDVEGFLEEVTSKKNPLLGRASYDDMKSAAAYCIGLMGDPRGMGILEMLRDSKVSQVSAAATLAIKRITHARKK